MVETGAIDIKTTEPKLNDKQLLALKFTYKFRYLTTDNLSRGRNITTNSAYSALTILHRRGYLGRKHTKSYRLQNKSARYYLTLKAVKLLSQPEYGLDGSVLLTRRYEDKKSQEFVDLQVVIFTAYLDIKDLVENEEELVVLTASEMAQGNRDNYLRSYPSLELHNKKTGQHSLIDIFPDTQHLFLAKKRIRKYLEHYEDDEWEWGNYPDVYLVRRSLADRRRLKSYIEEKMDDNYLDEEDFEMFVVKEAGECLL